MEFKGWVWVQRICARFRKFDLNFMNVVWISRVGSGRQELNLDCENWIVLVKSCCICDVFVKDSVPGLGELFLDLKAGVDSRSPVWISRRVSG